MADEKVDDFLVPDTGGDEERCLVSVVLRLQRPPALLAAEDGSDHLDGPGAGRYVEGRLALSVPVQDELLVSHQRLDHVHVLPEGGQVGGVRFSVSSVR